MTAFSLVSLAIMLVSLGGLVFLGATVKERAGSVVVPATVERVPALNLVVARVDGRLMDVRTAVSYDRHTHRRSGPGYVRGSRIEVRYWPGKAEMATDTAREVRLPGTWVFVVAAAGLLLGLAGLLVPAFPLRTRSA
ncbi:hypothetical protein Q5425_08910 [Amycolatopsis sp. A133]|uniref:hypothetical protein n=1 Tax=Amycolatopsis sp. A133 TaxID=3064472 RepID=UPI0027E78C8A|nr:hypothetical protein [Amycolatopsis sp. A133]MDQ7803852.1 hypothetical protein [Amycolatopsis sp. A133]